MCDLGIQKFKSRDLYLILSKYDIVFIIRDLKKGLNSIGK